MTKKLDCYSFGLSISSVGQDDKHLLLRCFCLIEIKGIFNYISKIVYHYCVFYSTKRLYYGTMSTTLLSSFASSNIYV